jgi:hypothetical protein
MCLQFLTLDCVSNCFDIKQFFFCETPLRKCNSTFRAEKKGSIEIFHGLKCPCEPLIFTCPLSRRQSSRSNHNAAASGTAAGGPSPPVNRPCLHPSTGCLHGGTRARAHVRTHLHTPSRARTDAPPPHGATAGLGHSRPALIPTGNLRPPGRANRGGGRVRCSL